MKKRNLTVVLTIFISISCFCQTSTDNFLLELKKKKIDTIFIFEDYYVGYDGPALIDETIKDYCEFAPTYIFWKENGQTLLTKKDSCFEYSSIEIDADKVLKYFFENEKRIKAEKIKNFQVLEIKNGKRNISTMMRDHSHHLNFKIIVMEKTTEKRFDDFDLLPSTEKEVNLNYKHNVNLKSLTLLNEIGKLISEYKGLIRKRNL